MNHLIIHGVLSGHDIALRSPHTTADSGLIALYAAGLKLARVRARKHSSSLAAGRGYGPRTKSGSRNRL